MQKVYIVDGLRSPIGQFGGQLSSWRPDDLLAELIRALMQKFPSVDPSAIEDVVIGCARQFDARRRYRKHDEEPLGYVKIISTFWA